MAVPWESVPSNWGVKGNVVYALMGDNITQDIKNVKILPVDEWGKWVYGVGGS
jgi:hypothetical protein